jgi:hypothetical protein
VEEDDVFSQPKKKVPTRAKGKEEEAVQMKKQLLSKDRSVTSSDSPETIAKAAALQLVGLGESSTRAPAKKDTQATPVKQILPLVQAGAAIPDQPPNTIATQPQLNRNDTIIPELEETWVKRAETPRQLRSFVKNLFGPRPPLGDAAHLQYMQKTDVVSDAPLTHPLPNNVVAEQQARQLTLQIAREQTRQFAESASKPRQAKTKATPPQLGVDPGMMLRLAREAVKLAQEEALVRVESVASVSDEDSEAAFEPANHGSKKRQLITAADRSVAPPVKGKTRATASEFGRPAKKRNTKGFPSSTKALQPPEEVAVEAELETMGEGNIHETDILRVSR